MGGNSLLAGGPDPKRLLETLETGAAYRAAGKRVESRELFDDAEAIIKTYDQQLLASSSAETLAALVVNDNALPYRGETYDGVMVNVFKALNFLADGKRDLARVELNRANERQRRAVEKFATQIRKQKEAIEAKSKASPDVPIEQTLANPELKKLVDSKYDDLSAAVVNWAAYPDFVNPFATYLHGLAFFMMAEDASDYEKARDSFSRVYGMTGKSKLIAKDLPWSTRASAARRTGPAARRSCGLFSRTGLVR